MTDDKPHDVRIGQRRGIIYTSKVSSSFHSRHFMKQCDSSVIRSTFVEYAGKARPPASIFISLVRSSEV